MEEQIVVAWNLTAAAESRPRAERAHLTVFLHRAQREREVVAQTVVAIFRVVLRRRRRQRTQQPRHLHPHAAVQVFVLDALVERNQQRNAEQRRLRLVVRQEVRVLPGELPVHGDEVVALPVVVNAPFVLARRRNRNVVVIEVGVAVCAAVELRVIRWRRTRRQIVDRRGEKIRGGNRFHAVISCRGVHESSHRTCAEHVD